MVILKLTKKLNYKVKASTLMETLVATVLIVVVFMVASTILNNLFSNSIKKNTRCIDAHLNELEYLYLNDALHIPYRDDFKTWEVSIKKEKFNREKNKVVLEATNKKTEQQITRRLIER